MARVLVTGASGYIGGHLVTALLRDGQQVRVLTRHADGLRAQPWVDQVEVVEGDASDASDCRRALAGVKAAYYLLHSMDGGGDFVRRERDMGSTFASAAEESGVARIVYLGGLHPDGELSEHLGSRVEVGKVFLAGPVPAVVFQAGVVLGAGSASFDMLRHLTERLPAMVAPRWVQNRIQPIAIADVLHYLVGALRLPADVNRTFDIGCPEVLTYAQMMRRYAADVGLRRRHVVTVPMLTPRLAGLWVDLVTPISSGIARPLVGSLVHDAVCREDDVLDAIGPPPGGRTGFDDAIAAAAADIDPHRWSRTLGRTSAIVAASAVTGSVLTNPGSAWYTGLRKPAWQPPPVAFPVVWTSLYTSTAVATALASADLAEDGKRGASNSLERALAVNMALNTAWTAIFFRAHKPTLATVECAVLCLSTVDLARRAGVTGRGKATAIGAYAAWCAFAGTLSAGVARLNPGHN